MLDKLQPSRATVPAQRGYWLLGSLPQFRRPLYFFRELGRQGSVVQFRLGWVDCYLINSAAGRGLQCAGRPPIRYRRPRSAPGRQVGPTRDTASLPADLCDQLACDHRHGGMRFPHTSVSVVFLSPWVTQLDPAYWTQPEEFHPERFTSQDDLSRSKGAYFPKAAGSTAALGNAWPCSRDS